MSSGLLNSSSKLGLALDVVMEGCDPSKMEIVLKPSAQPPCSVSHISHGEVNPIESFDTTVSGAADEPNLSRREESEHLNAASHDNSAQGSVSSADMSAPPAWHDGIAGGTTTTTTTTTSSNAAGAWVSDQRVAGEHLVTISGLIVARSIADQSLDEPDEETNDIVRGSGGDVPAELRSDSEDGEDHPSRTDNADAIMDDASSNETSVESPKSARESQPRTTVVALAEAPDHSASTKCNLLFGGSANSESAEISAVAIPTSQPQSTEAKSETRPENLERKQKPLRSESSDVKGRGDEKSYKAKSQTMNPKIAPQGPRESHSSAQEGGRVTFAPVQTHTAQETHEQNGVAKKLNSRDTQQDVDDAIFWSGGYKSKSFKGNVSLSNDYSLSWPLVDRRGGSYAHQIGGQQPVAPYLTGQSCYAESLWEDRSHLAWTNQAKYGPPDGQLPYSQPARDYPIDRPDTAMASCIAPKRSLSSDRTDGQAIHKKSKHTHANRTDGQASHKKSKHTHANESRAVIHGNEVYRSSSLDGKPLARPYRTDRDRKESDHGHPSSQEGSKRSGGQILIGHEVDVAKGDVTRERSRSESRGGAKDVLDLTLKGSSDSDDDDSVPPAVGSVEIDSVESSSAKEGDLSFDVSRPLEGPACILAGSEAFVIKGSIADLVLGRIGKLDPDKPRPQNTKQREESEGKRPERLVATVETQRQPLKLSPVPMNILNSIIKRVAHSDLDSLARLVRVTAGPCEGFIGSLVGEATEGNLVLQSDDDRFCIVSPGQIRYLIQKSQKTTTRFSAAASEDVRILFLNMLKKDAQESSGVPSSGVRHGAVRSIVLPEGDKQRSPRKKQCPQHIEHQQQAPVHVLMRGAESKGDRPGYFSGRRPSESGGHHSRGPEGSSGHRTDKGDHRTSGLEGCKGHRSESTSDRKEGISLHRSESNIPSDRARDRSVNVNRGWEASSSTQHRSESSTHRHRSLEGNSLHQSGSSTNRHRSPEGTSHSRSGSSSRRKVETTIHHRAESSRPEGSKCHMSENGSHRNRRPEESSQKRPESSCHRIRLPEERSHHTSGGNGHRSQKPGSSGYTGPLVRGHCHPESGHPTLESGHRSPKEPKSNSHSNGLARSYSQSNGEERSLSYSREGLSHLQPRESRTQLPSRGVGEPRGSRSVDEYAYAYYMAMKELKR